MSSSVDLSRFQNSWFDPGRGLGTRVAWLLANRAFLQTTFPWPCALKAALLRVFGAKIGRGVVLKNRINVKYPWRLEIGDHSWIGEGAWIDSLAQVTIGRNACLSQGVMLETGNHDWSSASFDLLVGAIVVEDGAWAAVKSLLLPGARLRRHAVLGAGSVLAGDTEEFGIYSGNPARKVKERRIRSA